MRTKYGRKDGRRCSYEGDEVNDGETNGIFSLWIKLAKVVHHYYGLLWCQTCKTIYSNYDIKIIPIQNSCTIAFRNRYRVRLKIIINVKVFVEL